MSALVLSKKDKLAVMVALRLRIHDLSDPARAQSLTQEERAEDLAEISQLKTIAEAMESAQVIVNRAPLPGGAR